MNTNKFLSKQPMAKVEANLIKAELRKAIKRQFDKHKEHNFLSYAEIVNIYSDALGFLLQPMPDNLAKETYLTNLLLND